MSAISYAFLVSTGAAQRANSRLIGAFSLSQTSSKWRPQNPKRAVILIPESPTLKHGLVGSPNDPEG